MGCASSKATKVKQYSNTELDSSRSHGLASYFHRALVKVHDINPLTLDEDTLGTLEINKLYDGITSGIIGSGTFGEVRKVIHKERNQVYACKTIRVTAVEPAKQRELMKEITIMIKLDHPNIIRVHEVFKSPAIISIVMEWADGGNLYDRIADYKTSEGRFSESTAKGYMVKMLRALNYLHVNKIAHRDLKLDNFLLSNDGPNAEIKLIDFGFSREYLERRLEERAVGTPYYMPPELFDKNAYDPFIGDMWSLGCILFMMVTGESPVTGKSTFEIFMNVKKLRTNHIINFGKIASKVAPITEPCQDLISAMMNIDLDARIKANDAVVHKWFTSDGCEPSIPVSLSERCKDESDIVLKISKFKEFSEMKRAALQVAAFYLDKDEIAKLSDQFIQMDKNNDGVLSYDEFHAALANRLVSVDSDCDIKEHFDAIDLDKTMSIQYSEFIGACLEEKKIQNEQRLLLSAFKAFDSNSDGKISKEELHRKLGSATDTKTIDNIFRTADVMDPDGFIDLDEFNKVMKGGRVSPDVE